VDALLTAAGCAKRAELTAGIVTGVETAAAAWVSEKAACTVSGEEATAEATVACSVSPNSAAGERASIAMPVSACFGTQAAAAGEEVQAASKATRPTTAATTTTGAHAAFASGRGMYAFLAALARLDRFGGGLLRASSSA